MNVIHQGLFELDLTPAAKKLLSYYIMSSLSYNNIGFESNKEKFNSDLNQYRSGDIYILPLAPHLSIRRLMDKLNLSNKTIIKTKQDISEYIDNDMLVIPTDYIDKGYVKLCNDIFLDKNPAIQITYSYLKSLTGSKATYYDSRTNLCSKLNLTLTNLNNQIAKLKKEGYVEVNNINGHLKVIK